MKWWSTKTRSEVRALHLPGRVDAVAFSPDGKMLAGCFAEESFRNRPLSFITKGIRIWGLPTGSVHRELEGDFQWVQWLFLPSDAKGIWCVSSDGAVRLRNAQSGLVLKEFAIMQSRRPKSVSFSADGRFVAASEALSDRVTITELRTAQRLLEIAVEKSKSNIIALSPDGRLLVTGSPRVIWTEQAFDQRIHLWEVATARRIATYELPDASTSSLAFSPDGKKFVSGMDTGVAVVWDTCPYSLSKVHSNEDVGRLWADLASNDAARAYVAVRSLAANGQQSVRFLDKQLLPAPEVEPQRLRHLIDSLGDDQFPVRDAASKELGKLGEQVRPALVTELKGNLPLEKRRRLEQLLARPRTDVTEEVRQHLRAVQTLEYVATSAARGVLQRLSKGAAEALETQAARAALERLAARPTIQP